MRDEGKAGSFADAAVELKLFGNEWSEIAFAVMLASMVRDAKSFGVEVLAHRCGITPAVADGIIFDAKRSAELLGQAHRHFIKIVQLGLEADVDQLIAERTASRAATKRIVEIGRE